MDIPQYSRDADPKFFSLTGSWAGIGSRETPIDIQILMARYARTAYDLELGTLHSGDAIGADFAFWVGARLSPNFDKLKAKIFISKNGYQNRWSNDSLGFINALSLPPDVYYQAAKIAHEARGGFYGLGLGGKQLMTRNTFQILSEDLQAPVKKLLYWGIPQGKKEKVRGGTNCALQVAIRYNIPRINLYHEQAKKTLEEWLKEKESHQAYPSNLVDIIESRRNHNPYPGF